MNPDIAAWFDAMLAEPARLKTELKASLDLILEASPPKADQAGTGSMIFWEAFLVAEEDLQGEAGSKEEATLR